MLILGIESSCDETAAAVVEDGQRLLSNVVHSQIDIHAEYGGVIPEVAARSHLEMINPVIRKALDDAQCTWNDIDAIAVTTAPGLIGSLLVGTLAARTLAVLHNKPLYAIHHVEAHVYANFITHSPSVDIAFSAPELSETASRPTFIEYASVSDGAADVPESSVPSGSTSPSAARVTRGGAAPTPARASSGGVGVDRAAGPADSEATWQPKAGNDASGLENLIFPTKQPVFPMLALIVSGGHSQLVLFKQHGDYKLIGETLDDAVGEAYDKVAKILGLPYPGGPSIAKAATDGDENAYAFPRARLQNAYDFSFSGLKTAVLRAVQHEVGVDHTFPSFQLAERLNDVQRANFAASFQKTANETLVSKTVAAFNKFKPASVVIAGGVAADRDLRRRLAEQLPIEIEYAPRELCTDNAAMIATLAYYQSLYQDPTDPANLEVRPSLSMRETAWRVA